VLIYENACCVSTRPGGGWAQRVRLSALDRVACLSLRNVESCYANSNPEDRSMLQLFKRTPSRIAALTLIAVMISLGATASYAKPSVAQRSHRRGTVGSRRTVDSRRVPIGTQMKIRLNDTVDSKNSRYGDKFRATVMTPRRYEESVIEGHLASVKQSGKFQG